MNRAGLQLAALSTCMASWRHGVLTEVMRCWLLSIRICNQFTRTDTIWTVAWKWDEPVTDSVQWRFLSGTAMLECNPKLSPVCLYSNYVATIGTFWEQIFDGCTKGLNVKVCWQLSLHNTRAAFWTVTIYKVSFIKFTLCTRPPVSRGFGKQNMPKATTSGDHFVSWCWKQF